MDEYGFPVWVTTPCAQPTGTESAQHEPIGNVSNPKTICPQFTGLRSAKHRFARNPSTDEDLCKTQAVP